MTAPNETSRKTILKNHLGKNAVKNLANQPVAQVLMLDKTTVRTYHKKTKHVPGKLDPDEPAFPGRCLGLNT